MNKTELTQAVAERADLTNKDAAKAVNATFEAIQKALAAGDKVTLPGIGTFEVRERAARVGRNPSTGEEIEIAASKVPAMKVGKVWKESM